MSQQSQPRHSQQDQQPMTFLFEAIIRVFQECSEIQTQVDRYRR